MSLGHGAKVPTKNLVLCIDYANPRCITPGDTTCKNLVDDSYDITGASGDPGSGTHTPDTNKFPAYSSDNSGTISWDGSDGLNVEGNLGATTEVTHSYFIYLNSSGGTGSKYISDARNGSGQWFLTNYLSYNFNWQSVMEYNLSSTYTASDIYDRWFHVAISSSTTENSLLYLNGEEVSVNTQGFRQTYEGQGNLDEDLGINFRIGHRYNSSFTAPFRGNMGPIHIYNRVLNAQEIKMIFDSFKDRFGL